MQEFHIGDGVKFKEGTKVPFRIRPGAKLMVKEVSSSGAVRISIEQASALWVKGELVELADAAVASKEGVAG